MALNARKPAAPAQGLVTTATLLRGRVYIFENQEFLKDVTREVALELGQKLEDLFEQVTDSEGEEYEKPTFEVLYDQEPLETVAPEPRSNSRRAQLQTSANRSMAPAPVTRLPGKTLPIRLPPRR